MKKNFREWVIRNWLHMLAWSIFIVYETIIAGIAFNLWGHPVTYIAHYSINICFFYFNANAALPWSLKNGLKGIYKLLLVLATEIPAFILLNYLCDYLLVITGIITLKGQFSLEHQYVLRVLYRCIYFLSFSGAYYFLVNYLNARKAAELSEKQRLYAIIDQEKMKQKLSQAQNAFLKAQINPHFLFNTLDYIYHHVNTYSQEVGDAILSLSDMMRYAVDSDSEGDIINLGNEIDQVKRLLGLYQLRKNQALNIDVYFSEVVINIKLIPLVLMTLVENIFKHGNLMQREHQALIAVYLENQSLHIKTKNFINYKSGASISNRGLKNIEDRLRYAYGENLYFRYGANEKNIYEVDLRISIESIDNFSMKSFSPILK